MLAMSIVTYPYEVFPMKKLLTFGEGNVMIGVLSMHKKMVQNLSVCPSQTR